MSFPVRVMEEPEKVFSNGCGATDMFCTMVEGLSNWAAALFLTMVDWAFGAAGVTSSSATWQAAVDQASFWYGTAVFAMLASTIVSVAIAILRRSSAHLGRALLAGLASTAALLLAIRLFGWLLDMFDVLASTVITNTQGDIASMLAGMIRPESVDGYAGTAALISIMGPPALTVVVIMLIAIGLIVLVDAFRTVGLVILLAFSPIAFSMLAFGFGRDWVKRWAAASVALLLAKPLMAGTFALLMAIGGAQTSVFTLEGLPMVVGLFVVAFMPFAAFSFFSFLGSAAQPLGDQVGSAAGAKAMGGTRMVTSVATRGAAGGARGGGGGSGRPQVSAATGGGGSASSGSSAPGGGGKPTSPSSGGSGAPASRGETPSAPNKTPQAATPPPRTGDAGRGTGGRQAEGAAPPSRSGR